MEWSQFIKYTAGSYLLYYVIMLVFDFLKPNKSKLRTSIEDNVLTFDEEDEIKEVNEEVPNNLEKADSEEIWNDSDRDTEEIPFDNENFNVSTGGINSLDEIAILCEKETIEIKKSLIFS